MKIIKVQSNKREEMIEITREVENALREEGEIKEGVCVLFTQHTTCGLTINENADPDVKHDILLFLKNTIPQFYEGFRHFEHNSDAHIKSSLMGSSVTVPFETEVSPQARSRKSGILLVCGALGFACSRWGVCGYLWLWASQSANDVLPRCASEPAVIEVSVSSVPK